LFTYGWPNPPTILSAVNNDAVVELRIRQAECIVFKVFDPNAFGAITQSRQTERGPAERYGMRFRSCPRACLSGS